MKRILKRILPVIVCAVLLFSSVNAGNGLPDFFSIKASASKITDYRQGDIIEFGWYPQSEVTDSSITSALNTLAGDNRAWTSYNYYSGTGVWNDGQMKPSDYMRYTDIIYGSDKYRGVIFDKYRPKNTYDMCSDDNSYQDSNGYLSGTIYWFRYEPIKWLVLDPETGMVIAETVLDSQAFNNYIISSDGACWGNSSKTYYANNYENSSIREWISNDFYYTAFTTSQQNIIENTTIENNACDTAAAPASRSPYNYNPTNDKIYIPSWDEVLNIDLGFSSNRYGHDTLRMARSSDYAKCQGVDVDSWGTFYGNVLWCLRSAGDYSRDSCYVRSDGALDTVFTGYGYFTYYTCFGIRPALNINPDSEIIQTEIVPEPDTTESSSPDMSKDSREHRNPGSTSSGGLSKSTAIIICVMVILLCLIIILIMVLLRK